MSDVSGKKQNNSTALLVMRILFTVLMLGTVVFIFSNSRQIGAASGLRSQQVTQWVNNILAKIGIGYRFTEYLVRKLAHFSEFALLGFWGMFTLRVYTKRTIAFLCWPLLFGLGIATLDETLQLFVAGRGAAVTDITIDFAGVLVGLCIALFIQLLVGAIFASFKALIGVMPDAKPTVYQMRRKPWPVFLRVLLPILSIVLIVFIFSNSMRTGAESSVISRKITAVISGVPEAGLAAGTALEGFIRKLGHFLEFALLGMVLVFTMRAFSRRILAYSAWPMFIALLTGVMDELIQLFRPDRACRVQDVLLDFGGALVGMAFGLVILCIGLIIDKASAPKQLQTQS